jgi:outer membrane protein TolC
MICLISLTSNLMAADPDSKDTLASPGLTLPPLDTLYSWADQYNPAIQFQNAVVERADQDIRRVGKQWLDALKLGGNLRVGSYGNTTINQIETGYTYGPSISFSLYEIVSRPNQMKIAKYDKKAAGSKRDEATLELHKYIRQLYNNILLQQSLLKIKSEALNTSYMHLKMAEKEFSEGAITLAELSRVNEIYTGSQIQFEMNVNDLKNLVMELEQTVGTPLI